MKIKDYKAIFLVMLYKQPITCNLKKPSIKLNTESHLYSLVYKMHVSRNGFVVFQKRDAYIIDLFISGYCIFRDQCQKPLIGCVLRFVVRLF